MSSFSLGVRRRKANSRMVMCGGGTSRRHNPLQVCQQSPQSRQHGRDQLLMPEKKPHRGDGQNWTASLFKRILPSKMVLSMRDFDFKKSLDWGLGFL